MTQDAKKAKRTALHAALAALGILIASTLLLELITDGETGVSRSFGTINPEPLGPGLYFTLPVVRSIETWDIKLQEVKETANVPSEQGLIVELEVSLLYRVLPGKAPQIRTRVGRQYRQNLVRPYFRNAMRDVASGYRVQDIYAEQGRKEIAARIRHFLQKNLEPRGIQIEDVLMRAVDLPKGFRESIEAKLTAEQKIQQKQFELEQARKEAEIEVARAEGAAQAQRIVRSTLSDSYLQYLWIKTLNENPNVIYVATEANMPIFKGAK